MDGERTFNSYLDDFDCRAREVMPAQVATALSALSLESPEDARTALLALQASGASCPELSFAVALCELACDHDRSPERTVQMSDLLAQAIRDVRELRAPADYALFFAYATVRYYDVLALALLQNERAMRLVIERIDKLDSLQDALGIADAALQEAAHTIGASDEDNTDLLAESYRVCDEAYACGASVAMALAENLTHPSELSPQALEEWYNLPQDIEAAAASTYLDYGGQALSELVRPQAGLTERTRQAIKRNAANER